MNKSLGTPLAERKDNYRVYRHQKNRTKVAKEKEF